MFFSSHASCVVPVNVVRTVRTSPGCSPPAAGWSWCACRLLPASGAKTQPAWASRSGHLPQNIYCCSGYYSRRGHLGQRYASVYTSVGARSTIPMFVRMKSLTDFCEDHDFVANVKPNIKAVAQMTRRPDANPSKTAVPFLGQTTQILSTLSPKRDYRSKRF